MQEIKFNYLPDESPTEHGWVLTEGQGQVQFLRGEDSHHGPFMRIEAEQDFCIDFVEVHQVYEAVEFIVRPGPGFASYAIVKVRNQHQKASTDYGSVP